jgi:hypothetical protein
LSRLAADNPTHGWIMAQPVGVVHVFVSRKAAEHGLPKHPAEAVAAVPAGSPVSERFPGYRAEAERVVEFAVGEQTSVGGHDRPAKLEHQPTVEIEPDGSIV